MINAIRIGLMVLVSFNVQAESNPQYKETFEIAVGVNHVCALTSIGVKCFGNSESLTTTAPLQLTNPRLIRAGNRFTCLLTDQGVRCFGEIPNTTKRDILINHSALPKPKLLAVGYDHACAVASNDKIKCWGRNDFGESTPPVHLKNITELSSGMSNSCAIAEGKVHCWGMTATGSLDVPDNLINPRHLTSGWWHHCVQSDEGLKCWGTPYRNFVNPDDSAIKEISSGGFYNCALVAPGVKCWDETGKTSFVEGSAGAYQLSMGPTVACANTYEAGVICWKLSAKGVFKLMKSFVPSGGVLKIENLSAGNASTCVYGDEGKLKCWGANFDNALDVPAVVSGPLAQLSSGSHKTCAITAVDSLLNCWGDASVEYKTPSGLGVVTMVSSGGNHICAGNNETFKCWGENFRGALDAPKDLTHITQLSAGMLHACAVAQSEVICWGGEGLINNVNPPKKIMNPKALCAGGTFSCALTADSKVQCWGEQLPLIDKNMSDLSLNKVLNVPEDVMGANEISCGQSHGCAITNGKIKCWGGGEFSSLTLAPPAGIKNPRMLSAGAHHTCVLGDNGLTCWGKMIGMKMPDYSLEK